MGWFSSIGKDVAEDSSKVVEDVPLDDLPAPAKIPSEGGAIEPIAEPATAPSKPGGGASGAVGALGVGVAGLGFILPSILNSSAVSSAIGTAGQVGSVAVIGNDVAGVANTLIGDITSSPTNMLIFGAGTVAVLYLLFRK